LHRRFVAFVRAEIGTSSVESLLNWLEQLRGELGGFRFALGTYFLWLAERVRGANGPSDQGKPGKEPTGIQTNALPLLSWQARVFRDILLRRQPEEPVVGSRLCAEYFEVTKQGIDEADFRTRIVPPLKGWGLQNKRKLGYFFPQDAPARHRE